MSNEILDSLSVETGRLVFKDVRYMLIRPDTIVDFQKAVEAMVGVERCAEAMMAGGYTGGSRSSKRYREVFRYTDQEIIDFMCKMGGEIGWGKFRLVELDTANRRLIVEVEDSPFAEAYARDQDGAGSEPRPVCHMIRGVLAGMAAGIFGGDVVSEEVACIAQGESLCRFVIQG